jgi:hypothetical protein
LRPAFVWKRSTNGRIDDQGRGALSESSAPAGQGLLYAARVPFDEKRMQVAWSVFEYSTCCRINRLILRCPHAVTAVGLLHERCRAFPTAVRFLRIPPTDVLQAPAHCVPLSRVFK